MLKNHSMAPTQPKRPTDLADLVEQATDSELERIYVLIQARLALDIQGVNLTEALMLQFRQGTRFVDEILYDKDVPANQRAQALNAVNSSLKDIVKMRTLVMTQDRQRRYEAAFLKTLDLCGTEEQRVVFMDLYGDFLNDRGE